MVGLFNRRGFVVGEQRCARVLLEWGKVMDIREGGLREASPKFEQVLSQTLHIFQRFP